MTVDLTAADSQKSELARDEAKANAASQLLLDVNEKLALTAVHARDMAERADQATKLLESVPDDIARFDREHRHLYTNAAVERSTGRSRSEFVGKTLADVGMTPALAAQWSAALTRAFATGTSNETMFSVDTAEGENFYQVRLIPEKDSDGAVTSVVTIARDVTASEMYRRARDNAARIGRLLSVTAGFSRATTPEDVARVLVTQGQEALRADAAMVMLVDSSSKNLKLAASFAYPREVTDTWSLLPLETNAPLTDVVRSRTPLFFESPEEVLARYPGLRGARHPEDEALAAVPLVFNDRSYGALALVYRQPREFADDDKAFIVLLARHCAQAIDRARLLAAERRARAEAETANRLKDEFLATMSHELRTPLNAVLGWTSILQNGAQDPALVRRGLDAIARSAKAQARLVEDVLDVSRIVTGKLRLDVERVDVGSAIMTAVDGLRAAAKTKQIELALKLDAVPEVLADAGRLEQIVWNLVSNALKFTPPKGRVDVSTFSRGENVAIEVKDSGIGLTSEFLPHVFERFRQADGSITRTHGGLGLGLAIVRHLVELQGGTVTAASEGEGRGATFTVELPAQAIESAQADDAATVDDDPHLLRGLRVLVVDDDEDARELAVMMLSARGADVVVAGSAIEALERVKALRPDVLVCDIGMPEMDGYSLMREVRALSASDGGDTPAIAVTGFSRREDLTQAEAAGFAAHIAKPVDLSTMARAVAEVTKRRG